MGKGELGRFRNELKSKRDREKDKVGEGGMRGEKKRGEKNTLTSSLIFCRIILAVIIFCPHHFRLAFVYLWTEFDHIFTVEL